jgi:gamma-glutamylcyclotransferase
MDGHHEQTMAARARAANDPPRRWFTYGTALDHAALGEWKAQHGYDFFQLPPGRVATLPDHALAFDFPSRFWGGRVASLRPAPGEQVFGLLHDIAGPDWPIVRHKEGGLTGMCDELAVRVLVDGATVDATTFVTRPARASMDGPVSQRFLAAMLAGASSAGLPAPWLEQIRQAAR